ncbi:MAG: DUF6786 family protein [Phycisphaerae bacterium]
MPESSYQDDLEFLQKHADVIQLSGADEATIAVVPAWQGRVMTSSLGGSSTASFGWIHRDFIQAGQDDSTFNNYGGEDRFWLGPEAGQFGLWFKPGEPFDLKHWKTPPGFNRGAFDVTSQGSDSVALAAQIDVTNYSNTTFQCAVGRTINLLDYDAAAEHLGATVGDDARMVAFESQNTLANAGDAAWSRDSGLLSIWILGMFKPLPAGWVIVPFLPGDEETMGPRATTDYFGPIGEDRCKVLSDHVLFKCDGEFRSKIGISPFRARRVLGSWDPQDKVLTIVQFNLPDGATRLPWVNSLWEMQDDPYAGDVVNSYNDGLPPDDSKQLGPFYEIETSSPAAELEPGASITHTHRTYHFAGSNEALSELARAVLGVDLAEVG